ncbi:unnamed protein product, partial [Allacma fusca]
PTTKVKTLEPHKLAHQELKLWNVPMSVFVVSEFLRFSNFSCPSYVLNANIKLINNKLIAKLRAVIQNNTNNSLQVNGGKLENENTEPVESIRGGNKRKCSSTSPRSGSSNNISTNKPAGDERKSEDGGGKKLRRDSSSSGNSSCIVKKHGVVGLRNLGNTCFMNAVLQSLSKINGFSTFMLRIPEKSLEIRKERRYYRTRSRLRPNQTLNATVSANCGNSNTSSPSSSSANASNTTVIQPDEILTTELCKILSSLNSNSATAVSPDALFSIIWSVMPRFRGYQQQDAHEFLRYMLDRLHNELIGLLPHWEIGLISQLKKSDKNRAQEALDLIGDGIFGLKASTRDMHNSIVTAVFSGVLQNEVRCCRCGTESKKHDPFLDLSLDIAEGEPKLQDCLTRFVDVEELVDNDMYFCGHCKTRQKSTKRFWITKLPNVLCLHLKRFRWSNYLRSKLDHFVEFPLVNLDMSHYMLSGSNGRKQNAPNGTNLYDLAAVIVHHGSGVGSGHYTAFAKKDSDWFNFNDSSVKLTQESIVAKAKAYILFYIRREFQL